MASAMNSPPRSAAQRHGAHRGWSSACRHSHSVGLIHSLDLFNELGGSHGCGECPQHAESGAGHITLHEGMHVVQPQPQPQFVAHTLGGTVERRVRRVDGYPPAYGGDYRALRRCGPRDAAEPFENERMVGDDEVTPFPQGFVHHTFGDVKTHQSPRALGGGGVLWCQLPACVIPGFLESRRSK